jgi:LL-diaminopimelate aminotransferase
MQSSFQSAQRIANFKPYFFAQLAQKLTTLKKNGVDVIRIDMGSPDLPPESTIIDKLISEVRKPGVHGYTPFGGTPAFKQAIADYYLKRFKVELDPQQETLALIGSKEGLFNLAQVIIDPGDVVLVPDPGYPVYSAGSAIAGGENYFLPILEENDYLPDLDSIPTQILEKSKILWLNYPNNPTGAIAPMSFFERVVAFGRQHHILIAHDAPYTDVCFDDYVAPSILQIPGAEQVCVEFNSLSKTYNMAGWRLGMAVGNADVIGYLNTYKSQMDSSHFAPILEAGLSALKGDQTWLVERNQIYRERRDIVVQGLLEAGFTLKVPPAAIYVWARLPAGHSDSMAFCNKLLEETGVSTTPGLVYGKHGEGYLRVSLGTPTKKIREAMQQIVDWLKK